MFYENTNHHIWLLFFYYVLDTVYIDSWKKTDKSSTHFGDALCKSRFSLIARGVQLDNSVNPMGVVL